MGKKRIIEKAEKVEGEIKAPKVSSKRKVLWGFYMCSNLIIPNCLLLILTEMRCCFRLLGLSFEEQRGTPYAAQSGNFLRTAVISVFRRLQ